MPRQPCVGKWFIIGREHRAWLRATVLKELADVPTDDSSGESRPESQLGEPPGQPELAKQEDAIRQLVSGIFAKVTRAAEEQEQHEVEEDQDDGQAGPSGPRPSVAPTGGGAALSAAKGPPATGAAEAVQVRNASPDLQASEEEIELEILNRASCAAWPGSWMQKRRQVVVAQIAKRARTV